MGPSASPHRHVLCRGQKRLKLHSGCEVGLSEIRKSRNRIQLMTICFKQFVHHHAGTLWQRQKVATWAVITLPSPSAC